MTRRAALFPLLLLAGCSLAPKYQRPALPVPPSWPVGDAYLKQAEAALPAVNYPQVFTDPRLQQVVARALSHNRDLRVAVANIEAARAQYRIQRAELFPVLDAGVGVTRRAGGVPAAQAASGAGVGGTRTIYSAELGVTAFEIDLFGRIRSLTGAALNRFFATEAAARAVRLTLVGDVADAWLQLAADRSLLQVAVDTARVAADGVRLTRARLDGGVAPRTDLTQAEQILAVAQADVAAQTTLVAQDGNLLQLLVGVPVEGALLPLSIADAAPSFVAPPAGVDSSVLLRRPDVVQAEYQLRAANGDIGAARAALFPRLSLSGLLSAASTAIGNLFNSDSISSTVSPGLGYTIFNAGAARANVRLTQAQRDAALAAYERAIQAAFRETADALARQGTIGAQLDAQRRFAAAAGQTLALVNARYSNGVETFLSSLDAQRALYTAQRNLVTTELIAASNRVALYRALGGDATLHVPPIGQ